MSKRAPGDADEEGAGDADDVVGVLVPDPVDDGKEVLADRGAVQQVRRLVQGGKGLAARRPRGARR
jgi:hypothetical protein